MKRSTWIFIACVMAGVYVATFEKDLSFLETVVFGIIVGVVLYIFLLLFIGSAAEIIRRKKYGIDMSATLKIDPEEVKSDMLFIMQHGHHKGIKGALDEFNDIFRNYPQWRLQDWDVFRAWYKNLIDHAIENLDIYILDMKDGSPYSKEADHLYDPNAPDWEQFDRKRYYDDDDYRDDRSSIREAAEEGFYTGLGLGATDNPLNP